MCADSAKTGSPLHVQLLWLPDALHGTLCGAIDVLRTAAFLMQVRDPEESPSLTWQIVTPAGDPITLPGLDPSRPAIPRQIDPGHTLIVVPGLLVHNTPHLGEIADNSGDALAFLKRHAARGGWIAAIYSGIVFPARLGLLDGARLAVPWIYQSWFKRQFPQTDFSAEEAVTLHGKVFTCATPSAQTEFMITVLGHLLDPDLMQTCSRMLVHQPDRQQLTAELIEHKWLRRTPDSPAYRAMQWLQSHPEQPYDLAKLADTATCSERTLLRHFQKAVGMTPLEYLQDLRVARAKIMLEVTLHNTHTIATACGYADARSFRRLFQRATGINPREYRERFALRTRRQYWRVETARLKAK